MKPQKVEISHKTITFSVIFLVAFLLSLVLLWKLRSIIVLFFICFIFMSALNPTVEYLEKKKIPRPASILFLYLIVIGVLAFGVAGIVPILIEQTSALIATLPNLLANTTLFGTPLINLSNQLRILEGLPSGIARTTLAIFSNIFSSFIVFVITFYLLLERKNFSQYSSEFFGSNSRNKALSIIQQFEKRLGSWVNAQIFLMVAIGLLSYVGYLILGLNYAVPLAIAAGLLEVVPNIGPTVATILAAVVGLTISPLTALLAVIWGIIVQQLENNFIVPKIMKETVGINPLVTILLIAGGLEMAGIMGAILSVPLYLTVEIVVKNLFFNRN